MSLLRRRMMMAIKKPSGNLPDYSSYRGVYIEDVDGYLYTEAEWDGSKTANGIAVLTDNCRFVMALHDTYDSPRIWGGYKKTVSGIVTTTDFITAGTDYAGVSNTDTIINELSGYNDSYVTGAPVAESCKAFTFPNSKKGYLGAAGEWKAALDNKESIAHALSKCGGLSMEETYWTSTQWDSDYCWSVDLVYDGIFESFKFFLDFVRAFTTLKSDDKESQGE